MLLDHATPVQFLTQMARTSVVNVPHIDPPNKENLPPGCSRTSKPWITRYQRSRAQLGRQKKSDVTLASIDAGDRVYPSINCPPQTTQK